jgi:hypothetical protein
MPVVYSIRWRITVYLLELGLRVVLLSALFFRPVKRRRLA